jgi:hypothetical protein
VDTHTELNLLPCSGCKELKVLKLGDYCRECALEPEPVWFEVTPGSLDRIARLSGMAREFLNAKQEKAFENFQRYVVYYADGKWQDITISERFSTAIIMRNLFKKLGES